MRQLIIRHEDLIGTFEQKQRLVEQFNLMDDNFFAVVMEDKAACEYLLCALLGFEIKVIETKAHYDIANLKAHSVELDVLAEDAEGKLYNIEIQVEDRDNHPKRVRYYQAAVDWSLFQKGRKYEELPELYLLFVSAFDMFGDGLIRYDIDRKIRQTGKTADNGVHEIYFNTKVDDGSQLRELMKFFNESSADDMRFGALSEAVNRQKRTAKGVEHMCKAVRDYVTEREQEIRLESKLEGKVESVNNLLQNGFKLEEALRLIGLTEQEYKSYKPS